MAAAAKSADGFPAGVNGGSATNPANDGEGRRDVEAGGGWSSTPALTTTAAAAATQGPPRGQRRLASLDVFRGITVVLMILVDDVGGLVPAISHSPWDGVTLADFVFPFFLFIVGVSLAFAYKRVPNKALATKKALIRASKLFLLGLLLQGGYFHTIHDLSYGVDLRKIRLMGILQRIAIAYFAVALCEIWLRSDNGAGGYALIRRYRHQLFLGLVLTVTYTALLCGMYVPDWEYVVMSPDTTLNNFMVKCGVKGDTGPGCNAVGMIDRRVLGIQHLYTFSKVDVYCYKKLFFPMEWLGKHALMIFVLVACNIAPILIHGFYWREPQNNLLKFIGIGG